MARLSSTVCLLLLAPTAATAQPSPEAVKLVEARRDGLEQLSAELRQGRKFDTGVEMARVDRALDLLARDLNSADPHVRSEATRDVLNMVYRPFPAERMAKLLTPLVKTPVAESETTRATEQGLLIDHLGRQYSKEAKEALPALLAIVTDEKAMVYLRGQAVEAAARIGKDEPAVIDAFLKAARNPNPASSSGVHERIAEKLGEIGQGSPKAKEALAVVMARGAWYQDPAFVALGKLALDKEPKPLKAYLDVLRKVDHVRMEDAAAAFLHVQKLVNPEADFVAPNTFAVFPMAKVDREAAAEARAVVYKMVDSRPADVYSRAAMRTLYGIGPGGGKEATRIVVDAVLKKDHPFALWVLDSLEASDPASVPILREGFKASLTHPSWVTRQSMAKALARHGKHAAPAAPDVIAALRAERVTDNVKDAYFELFTTYLDTLTAMGRDAPGVRDVVLDLLAADSPVLTKSAKSAPHYRATLLGNLSKAGLPVDRKRRAVAIGYVTAALASTTDIVFAAAAAVVASDPTLTLEEAKPLVRWLTRVLADDFRFVDPDGTPHQEQRDRFRQRPRTEQVAAVKALAALGPKAKDALPALKELSARPITGDEPSYTPPPAINAVITEARKAVEAISKP